MGCVHATLPLGESGGSGVKGLIANGGASAPLTPRGAAPLHAQQKGRSSGQKWREGWKPKAAQTLRGSRQPDRKGALQQEEGDILFELFEASWHASIFRKPI
jgi:hypothetical protein